MDASRRLYRSRHGAASYMGGLFSLEVNMGSGGKGRDQQQQNQFQQFAQQQQQQAQNQFVQAKEPDEFEKLQREYLKGLWDWRTGKKGPLDVRNLPDAAPLALFNEAKQSRDAGRIGRGLATLADGANPNFAVALDKENQLERDLSASGALEGNVDDLIGGLDSKMLGIAQIGNDRAFGLANLARGLASDAYGNYFNWLNYQNNKKPGFLSSLLGGLAGGLSFGGKTAGGMSWAI